MAVRNLLDLSGQVAVVTGGTRGLGRDIAVALADAGATVAVCGRNTPEGRHPGVAFHAVDVRDPDAAKAFVDAVAEGHGRLDIVVNNAGGSPHADAATSSARFFESILRLNSHAAMWISQAAFAHMRKAASGSIVNIASVSGIRPSPATAAYGAAKAGLLNLTQSLAQEWGPEGVRVNAIIAGLTSRLALATCAQAAPTDARSKSIGGV